MKEQFDIETYEGFKNAKSFVVQKLRQISEFHDKLDLKHSLNEQIDKLNANIFQVMVLGEFSSGKSTFINSLLGEEILPMRIDPTTAVINEISYGEVEKITVEYIDGKSEEVGKERLEDLITIKPGKDFERKSNVRIVRLKYPLKFCQEEVRIIDSPGLNDDQTQTEITYGYMPNLDVAIFIFSALMLASETERTFLKERIFEKGYDNIFFLINKYDLVRSRDKEALHKRAETELLPLLRGKKDRLFYVSALDALDGKIEENEELISKSGIHNFEQELENFLTTERGKAQLKNPINQAKVAIRELRKNIDNRLLSFNVEINELERRYREVEPKFKELNITKNSILSKTEDRKEMLYKDLELDFIEFSKIFETNLTDTVKDFAIEEKWNPKKIKEEIVLLLNKHIEAEFTKWTKKAEEKATHSINRLINIIELDAIKLQNTLDEIVHFTIHGKKLEEMESETSTKEVVEKILTVAGGLLIGNLATAVGGAQAGWKGALRVFGLQFGTNLLMILLGVTSPIIFIGSAVVIGIAGVFLNRDLVISAIKKKVAERAKAEVPKIKEEVLPKIKEQLELIFNNISGTFERGIDLMINNVRVSLDNTINERKRRDDYVATETKRLNELRSGLENTENELDDFLVNIM